MTFYFSKQDFRHDMHVKTGATRAHAICRHLLATASQDTPLYGAYYWASCALLEDIDYNFTRASYEREMIEYKKITSSLSASLWAMALSRVGKVIRQAKQLKSSVLW